MWSELKEGFEGLVVFGGGMGELCCWVMFVVVIVGNFDVELIIGFIGIVDGVFVEGIEVIDLDVFWIVGLIEGILWVLIGVVVL